MGRIESVTNTAEENNIVSLTLTKDREFEKNDGVSRGDEHDENVLGRKQEREFQGKYIYPSPCIGAW